MRFFCFSELTTFRLHFSWPHTFHSLVRLWVFCSKSAGFRVSSPASGGGEEEERTSLSAAATKKKTAPDTSPTSLPWKMRKETKWNKITHELTFVLIYHQH